MELSNLKVNLKAAEDRESEMKSHLERANATIDALSSNSTNKDDKLFAALTELGQTKGQLAVLEKTLEQQMTRNEEARATHNEAVNKLKVGEACYK